MSAAGAVPGHGQRVDAAEQHGIHVDEAGGEDAAGLRGQELPPGRAGTAGRGINPGVVQDLPGRGGRDRMAGPGKLTLHPPVPPRGALRRDADHELADPGRRGRPPGTPPARIIPLARDKPPVPGQQRCRGHRGHLAPPGPGNQPRQRREPQPAARLVTGPAGLAAQDGVLMPQHQQPGILGRLAPGQHHQAAQQAANEQAGNRNDHPAMIPARKSDQARFSNRASQALEPVMAPRRHQVLKARPVTLPGPPGEMTPRHAAPGRNHPQVTRRHVSARAPRRQETSHRPSQPAPHASSRRASPGTPKASARSSTLHDADGIRPAAATGIRNNYSKPAIAARKRASGQAGRRVAMAGNHANPALAANYAAKPAAVRQSRAVWPGPGKAEAFTARCRREDWRSGPPGRSA